MQYRCISAMLTQSLNFQEQAEVVAHVRQKKESSLLLISIKAFISNRHLQLAKRQASQHAAELRRRLLLKTVMAAWRSHMQVASCQITTIQCCFCLICQLLASNAHVSITVVFG